MLVLAGDHIYKMDYGPMIGFHVEMEADITVGVVEVPLDRAREFGVLTVGESNRVVRFQEKPLAPEPVPGRPDVALASMGIYVFNPKLLERLLRADSENPDSAHDFGKNVIPDAIDKLRMFAYPFEDVRTKAQNYWRDVGTVDAYYDANMELVRVSPELNIYDEQWPIWTYQEQLPPAKFVFDEAGPPRHRNRFHGIGRLHHLRLAGGELAAVLQRAGTRSLVDRTIGAPAAGAGRRKLCDTARDRRRGSCRSGRRADRRGPGRGCRALLCDGGRHRARHFGYAQGRAALRLSAGPTGAEEITRWPVSHCGRCCSPP